MAGRALKHFLTLLEMKRPDPAWPHRIVRDLAYLFIPFAFAAFLLLLGGALLITWGKLSNPVLVGFCVTAGILIAFFAICHLALYFTWARKRVDCMKTEGRSSSNNGGVVPARSVKLGSPRACRNCMGGLPSTHVPAVATFGAMRRNSEVTRSPIEEVLDGGVTALPPQAVRNLQRSQVRTRNGYRKGAEPMSNISAIPAALNIHHTRQRDEARGGFYSFQHPQSPHSETNTGGAGILLSPRAAQVRRPNIATSITSPGVLSSTLSSDLTPLETNTPSERAKQRAANADRRQQPQTASASRLDNQRGHETSHTPPTLPPAQRPAARPGSPLRQVQPAPYSPQDVGSSSFSAPRPAGPRPRIVPARTQPAPDDHTRPITAQYSSSLQQATGPWLPYRPPDETHMIVFYEPDLAELIARGVFKVDPDSDPPEWMLLETHLLSSPKASTGAGDGFYAANCGRRPVELTRTPSMTVRESRARSENRVAVAPGSVDSGYCSAAPGLVSGDSTLVREDPKERPYAAPLLPYRNLGSAASYMDERRVLRRQSSVPEIATRFQGAMWEDRMPGAESEGSRVSLGILERDWSSVDRSSSGSSRGQDG